MRRALGEMNLLGRRRCAFSGHGFGTNLGRSGRLGISGPSASSPIAKDLKRSTKVIQRSLGPRNARTPRPWLPKELAENNSARYPTLIFRWCLVNQAIVSNPTGFYPKVSPPPGSLGFVPLFTSIPPTSSISPSALLPPPSSAKSLLPRGEFVGRLNRLGP